jgi:hypothetical protein
MGIHLVRADRRRERAARSSPKNRSLTVAARSSADWRGWIALAWVVFWGCAYALMMLQARAPRILHGIWKFARGASS